MFPPKHLRLQRKLRAILETPGWLSGNEAKILQRYVTEQQRESKADMLEIGCWKGRSSIVIASRLSKDRRLWIVDHFHGSLEHQKRRKSYTSKYTRRKKLWTYPEFLENVIKYKVQNKVIILPLSSEKAAKVVDEKFSLIFIDGDHEYEGISEDCNLWLPHLEENGVLIFHDYQYAPIHKFCNELKQNEDLSVILELYSMIAFRHH